MKYILQRFLLGHIGKYFLRKFVEGVFQPTFYLGSASYEEVKESFFYIFLLRLLYLRLTSC